MRGLVAVAAGLCASAVLAQPSIRSSTSSSTDSSGTTHNVTQPTPIEAGDLVINCIIMDDANNNMSFGWDAGLTAFSEENQGSMRGDCAWYEATGTEDGSTIAMTSSLADTTAHFAVAFCDAADPDTTPPESAEANGVSTAPDPPSLTPSGGSAAYKWMAIIGAEAVGITAFPSGYSDTGSRAAGGLVPQIHWSFRDNTASSENPGAGTLASADQWTAHTISIPPGSNSACPSGGGGASDVILRRRR